MTIVVYKIYRLELYRTNSTVIKELLGSETIRLLNGLKNKEYL